jgi:thymidylate synthase (FAD)
MSELSKAKVIGFNIESERICASAARISTTKGNAFEIYDMSDDSHKNTELIKKVLNSGHKSIIEHAFFSIAFCNVSAVVEQFFIEFRLSSYTVKSRRYVDFGNMGYYVPENMDKDLKSLYKNHMDFLFSEYSFLIDHNVPKEDARFILPYSFCSNFYCTCNARELIYILQEILYGRGGDNCELVDIANQIVEQIQSSFPGILSEIEEHTPEKIHSVRPKTGNEILPVYPSCELIEYSSSSVNTILTAYNISNGISTDTKYSSQEDEKIYDKIIHSTRSRELEHFNAAFLIQNITLSGITHIVRHRMQSIIIPPLRTVDCVKMVIPDSIQTDFVLLERYYAVFEKNIQFRKMISENGFCNMEYLNLSGNTLDVMTTMNARELIHFLKLRSCARAQWEIRDIAVMMLKSLRKVLPEVFNKAGPSCFVDNRCPEGRLSCGKMKEIIASFK